MLTLQPTLGAKPLLGGSASIFCFSKKKKCAASVTHMTGEGLRNLFLRAALAPEPYLRSGPVGAAFSLGSSDGAELAPGEPCHHLVGDSGHLVHFRRDREPPSLTEIV